MNFLDLVKKNYEQGRTSLLGTQVSDEFVATRLVQPAHSVPEPMNIARTDPRLTWSSVNIVTVAQTYTAQSPNSTQMKVEFMSDLSLVQVKTIALGGMYTVFVDGKIANTIQINAGGVTNEVSWIQIAAKDGVQRKMRHFEIYGVNSAFGAFVMQAKDTITNDLPSKPLIYQIGDSYTFGTGASYPGEAISTNIALSDSLVWGRALGFSTYNDGVGSSGWNSDGTNPAIPKTITRFTGRLVNFNRKIDVISLALGLNDASSINEGTAAERLVENFRECMIALRRNFPYTPVVLISCATPAGITENQRTLNKLLSDNCAEFGVEVINISDLITDGNKATYGYLEGSPALYTHPNGLGHQYRGLGIASGALKAAIGGYSLLPEKPVKSYMVTYIERLRFAANVKREVVQAKNADEAYWMVKSREYGNPNLRIEIISVV